MCSLPKGDALSLPKGWEVKKLGEVCFVIAGQSPEGKYYNSKENGLPFYQGKKEFSRKFIGKPTKWTTKVTKEAEANDILMSVRAPVGPINFSTQKICIGRGLAAIRANELIDKEFLFNFLLKNEDEIVGNTGAVFNSINKNQIQNILIPLPPLHEQKRIVAILDQAFTAIDQAKANTEKNLKNARELFQSKLQETFDNGKLKIDNGEWEEKKLGEVCDVLDKLRKPITKSNRIEGEYPYYGATGILSYVHEYIFDEKLVLIGEDGAKWKSGDNSSFIVSGKYWVNNHAHVIRPMRGFILDEWVVNFLNFSDLTKYITGMTVPKLNQKKMKNIPIPLPPLPEQKQIVKKLDSVSTETKKLEAIYQRKITCLDELKKSILQKAFNGEL